MRRSAAPSLVSSAKKPRFHPPFSAASTNPEVATEATSFELRRTLLNIRRPPLIDNCCEDMGALEQNSPSTSYDTVNYRHHGDLGVTSPTVIVNDEQLVGSFEVGSEQPDSDIHEPSSYGKSSVVTTSRKPLHDIEQVTAVKKAGFRPPARASACGDTLSGYSTGTSGCSNTGNMLSTGTAMSPRIDEITDITAIGTDGAVGRPLSTGVVKPKKGGFRPPARASGGSGGQEKGGFRPPSRASGGPGTSQEKSDAASCSSDSDVVSKYYNVMWCKMSRKKHKTWEGDGYRRLGRPGYEAMSYSTRPGRVMHKTWEGDAILVVRGRTALLKDMEGKDIAKGTGYRPSELAGMCEGSTLIVGGKEIEVMGELSSEDWKTGKCFTQPGTVTPSPQSTCMPTLLNHKSTKKGFTAPSRFSSSSTPLKPTPATISPLYDPTSHNSLVMPRPSPKHQLQHNGSGQMVVDVVIDPRLVVTLRPHQREGVTFLYECMMGLRDFAGNGAILADEMGLGKTLQCITTLWTLIKQGPYGGKSVVRRALVITPGSLVKNWECEFRKWLGTERLHVFAISGENRVEDFVKSKIYPVLIISYEMFLRSHDALKAVTFDLLVCDEGHRLKNAGAKTTASIMTIPTRKRIVLTGTPIQNDLQEFYSIVEFCNPGLLGSHAAFRRVYENPIVQSRQPAATPEEREIGENRANELSRLTSLFCLRRTQEINNKYLPPKVESVVFCRMAPLQLSIYRHLLSSCLVQSCFRRRNNDFSPHLVCIGALKKLCNSPSLLHGAAQSTTEIEKCRNSQESGASDDNLYSGVLPFYPSGFDPLGSETEHSGKLRVLDEMLAHIHGYTSERIVLVSNYTQTLDLLQRLCEQRGYGYLRLDGSTPASKRQPLVDQFNSRHSSQSVFLLSSKAGGVGLNLTGASRLLLYDIDWNPANDMQAMARVWRDGQKRKVFIYRLLTTGSIEEKIYQRQVCKQGLSTVVDGRCDAASGSVKFSLEELKNLFTVNDNTSCDTHDLLECSCLETDTTVVTPVLTRKCQLGYTGPAKNVSMDKLLEWKHFSSPIDQTGVYDELLLQAASEITFVFQNESNSQAASVDKST